MKTAIITFFISLSVIWAQENFQNLSEIAEKSKDGDKQALAELYNESLKKENKSLRQYMVKAVTLLMLKSGSKSTAAYLKKVSTRFPNEDLFRFLEIPPIQHECTKCTGFGKTHINCQKCKASGDCKNCKGKGAIIYGNGKSRTESPCIQCKSSGHCKSCKGTQKIVISCIVCRSKGSVFSKESLREESSRAFNLLIQKSYELDGDESTVFDTKVIEQEKQINSAGEEWLAARKNKDAEWQELEKKRFAAVKKKQTKKDGPNYITTVGEEVVETYEEGGSTSTLDHICLEIKEYLTAQELKSKQKFLIKVYGQFLSDIPTVHLVVSENFSTAAYDYKKRAADGFYRFAVLRAQQNGYDEIDFKLLEKDGSQIGGIKENGFWIKK